MKTESKVELVEILPEPTPTLTYKDLKYGSYFKFNNLHIPGLLKKIETHLASVRYLFCEVHGRFYWSATVKDGWGNGIKDEEVTLYDVEIKATKITQ